MVAGYKLQQMLKLRCFIYSGTFENVFSAYATRARAKRLLRNA